MAGNQTTAQVRVVDPILSNVAQGYRHVEHVGSVLFPRVPVFTRGGQIIEFGRESFRRYNARRAPGAATKRVEFGHLGKPFALFQDALEGKVPREHMDDASQVPGIDLGSRTVNGVMQIMSLLLEIEQANIANDPANYDGNHTVALAGGQIWTDTVNSDPTADIETGREAIRASIGRYPNTLELSALAFKAVKHHPKITDRFKFTSSDSITAEMLANLWNLERVVVGQAIVFEDDDTATDIWSNNAVLAYTSLGSIGAEEPSYGYTYTLNGHPLVEQTYWDPNAKSWIYPTTFERAPVLSGILAGYLIQNAG